jgi:uncharacterized protein with predicted RNA binding PUA domain
LSLITDLRRIQSIADYQFGAGAGEILFPDGVDIEYSRATGRIRFINLNGQRLATLRPTDGLLSLSINAACTLVKAKADLHCLVTVRQDIAKFTAEGGDVFAAHVVKVDPEIRPKEEVIVLDEAGVVVSVGRALLSASEMAGFKTGVAIKVRHGAN